MLERKSLLTCLLGACLLVSIAIDGCSDSKPRQSAKNILDEVATAKRLCDAAVALMVTVPYEVNKEFPPAKADVRKDSAGKPDLTWVQSNVSIPPAGSLNPNAWKKLETALNGGKEDGADIKGIKAVLEANPDAPADEKAIGQTMMAQVLSLMGDYRLAQAQSARAKASADLDTVAQALTAVQRQGDFIKTYTALADLSTDDLKKEIEKAAADATTLDGQKKTSEAQLTKLKGDLDAANKNTQKLKDDASNIRLQRETTTGPAKMELTDKANDLDKQAAAESGNVSKLELAIAQENMNLELTKAKLGEATKRQEVAQGIITARESTKTQATNEKNKAVGERAKLQESLEKAAGEFGKDLDEAVKLKGEAAKLYGQAADACTKAAGTTPMRETQLQKASSLKSAAMAALAMTDLQARSALIGTQATDTYKSIGQDLPASLSRLTTPAGDSAAASNDAAQKYADAAKLYESIITALPLDQAKQKWSYQVQAAAAYAGEYWSRPTGAARDAALEKAKTLLNDAVSGKAASPYLAEAAKLQAQLGLPVTAPTAPATPAPTAAPTPAASAPATTPA